VTDRELIRKATASLKELVAVYQDEERGGVPLSPADQPSCIQRAMIVLAELDPPVPERKIDLLQLVKDLVDMARHSPAYKDGVAWASVAMNDASKVLTRLMQRDAVLLDPRELAAVLAGLRIIQSRPSRLPPGIDEVYTAGDTLVGLDAPELEALCVRLNTGDL